MNEIKKMLESKGIRYDAEAKKWLNKSVKTTLAKVAMSLAGETEFTADEITESMQEIEGESNDTAPKVTPQSCRQCVEKFMDDLEKAPSDRLYVQDTVDNIVVDRTFVEPAYSKTMFGRKYDDVKIAEIYRQTVKRFPKVFIGADCENDLRNYVEWQQHNNENETARKISYDKSCEANAEIFLKVLWNLYRPAFISVDGSFRYDYALFASAIRQFIWNVKKRAIEGIVENPIMLVVDGAQGNGKSHFFEALCHKVLGSFYGKHDITSLADTFASEVLGSAWVFYSDELVKSGKAIDENKLKQIITADEVSFRQMFSQSQRKVHIRATFCATANSPVYEIIHDDTGMRRYVNLTFTNPAFTDNDKELKDTMDELWEGFCLALWKSVDPSKGNGYLIGDTEKLLKDAQKLYVSANNTLITFLKDNEYTTCTHRPAGQTYRSFKEIYKEYEEWCVEKKKRAMGYDNYCKFLQSKQRKNYAVSQLSIVKSNSIAAPSEEDNPLKNFDKYRVFKAETIDCLGVPVLKKFCELTRTESEQEEVTKQEEAEDNEVENETHQLNAGMPDSEFMPLDQPPPKAKVEKSEPQTTEEFLDGNLGDIF